MMANYYLRFVAAYADIAEPLRTLLRKGVDWDWSEACESAFRKLKEAITSAPTIGFFTSDAPTFLSCDASDVALGAVLSQRQGNCEVPIAFASRALFSTERRYSVGEHEALACLWACEKWDVYLYGRRFTLSTDHQALTSLLEAGSVGRRPLRMHRWADRLMRYNFDVVYKPGKENQVADCLSRDIGPGNATTEQRSSVEEVPSLEGDSDEVEIQLMTEATGSLISLAELEKESKASSILQEVARFVRKSWPRISPDDSLRGYFAVRHELSLWGQESVCVARGDRAVIPPSLREKVLDVAHEGHLGIVRVEQRCRESVWWPGIDKHIEGKVCGCDACQRSGKSLKPREAPLQPLKWPAGPWRSLEIDVCGEIVPAPQHQRFLIVVHDRYSKWPEVRAVGAATSAVISFLGDLFARWGLPEEVISDNGAQFVSFQFEEFLW